MESISNKFENKYTNIKKILIGSGVSIVLTIVGLIIFSCLIAYTDVKESTIPTVVIIITAISILIGSTVAMSNLRKNGIINGAMIGLIYIMVIYSLSSLIEKDFALNTHSIIIIIASIIAGALGGVIGVNKK